MASIKTTIFFLFLSSLAFGQGHSFDTALVNNQQSIRITVKALNNDLLRITSTSGVQSSIIDTIESNGLAYIKYPDFNKDGNADILIDYFGSNSTYLLYLFDPEEKNFKQIENYLKYPDAVQLNANSEYYYSYKKAGCADLDWVSDLFKIQDFKIVQLAHIEGNGCDFNVKISPQVIKIFKVTNNDVQNRILIEELSYLKNIPEFEDKWNFIQKYWNKNYIKFEKNDH